MFYTALDKKLLASMIAAQSDLQSWVVVNSEDQSILHSSGWESDHVHAAEMSGNKMRISLKPYEIELALNNLQELGFIEKGLGGPAYHVTYRGWYDKAMRIRNAVYSFLQNILLPIIVAVLSSIATTIIMQIIITMCKSGT